MDAPQKIVVDGYNLIYADDRLRGAANVDIQRSRAMLVSLLAAYLRNKDLRMTVVFDGRGGMTDTEMVIPGKLEVVYSARHQSADELIVAMIRGAPNPRSHIVVTSDRAHIRPAVAEIGCAVIESTAFLARIRGKRPAGKGGQGEEKPRNGSSDTDYWLERFERGS